MGTPPRLRALDAGQMRLELLHPRQSTNHALAPSRRALDAGTPRSGARPARPRRLRSCRLRTGTPGPPDSDPRPGRPHAQDTTGRTRCHCPPSEAVAVARARPGRQSTPAFRDGIDFKIEPLSEDTHRTGEWCETRWFNRRLESARPWVVVPAPAGGAVIQSAVT